MLALLRVVGGQDADRGRSAGVGAGGAGLVIGRGPEAGLRLQDPTVSRVHCRVTVSEGKAWLEDAGGAGGTLVNGAGIQRHELRPGDVIRVGGTEVEFHWSDVDELPTTGWAGL